MLTSLGRPVGRSTLHQDSSCPTHAGKRLLGKPKMGHAPPVSAGLQILSADQLHCVKKVWTYMYMDDHMLNEGKTLM